MERIEVMEKLQDIIREAVDNDEVVIEETTVASDVQGWDSLTQVLIVGDVQNEFGVKLTSSEVMGLANVGELLDIIMKNIK